MEKMGTTGLSHMAEKKVCLDCSSEMLAITIDGETLEGYLCFVCGKEVRI